MKAGELFEKLKEEPGEPEPERKKRKAPWNETDSIALVAQGSKDGVLLVYDGPGVEGAIEDVGEHTDDLGLDDAPDGLSIWEGRYHTSQYWTDCGYEYDAELVGKFRELTDQEWELFRATGTPWEYEE